MSVSGMKRTDGQTRTHYFAFILFLSRKAHVTNEWIELETHAEYIAHEGIV